MLRNIRVVFVHAAEIAVENCNNNINIICASMKRRKENNKKNVMRSQWTGFVVASATFPDILVSCNAATVIESPKKVK